MIAEVEQPDGSYINEERDEAQCGKDFCDRCGDCLHCDGDICWDGGYDNGPHIWVIYIEQKST